MTHLPEPPPQNPPRILLVDDDSVVLRLLYTLLEREGCEVLSAGDALDALAIFRRTARPIDLLIADYHMPRMSGLELARKCEQVQAGLNVLYVSGAAPDQELKEDLRMANRRFLAKPFRAGELMRKTRDLLPGWAEQFSQTC